MLRVLAFASAIFSVGCTYDATSKVDGTFEFALGSLDKSCNGPGSSDEGGHSNWIKSNDGTTCRVQATWKGNLVDMPAVRAKVEAELKKNSSDLSNADVSFEKIELIFHDPQLVPPLPVQTIDVSLSLNMETLSQRHAADLGALFDNSPISLSKAEIKTALDDFNKNLPLVADGTADFDVPMSSLPPVATDGKLIIQLHTDVCSQLTIKALN
jgi:hypothetical protein